MDRALELGINFFDTANRYGGEKGPRRPPRTIIGKLVRAGRRPPREGRARDEGLRADDRRGRTTAGSRRGTSARVRREPAPAADRPHRPVPDAPRRPRHARGTRSGRRWRPSSQQGKVIYVGSSNFAGWHIAQANEAAKAPRLPRPRERAEPLQPRDAHGRARSAARVPRLRRRRDPVEPARRAGCSAACWTRSARAGAATERARNPGQAPCADRGLRGPVRRAGREAGDVGARLAAAPAPRSPAPSSARAPWNSWTRRCTRSPSTSATTCSSGSTTSSPGTSPLRSITPGKNASWASSVRLRLTR